MNSTVENITFKSIEIKDIPAVAKIHTEELPKDIGSILGMKFLEIIFYPELLQVSPVTVAAKNQKGEIKGFVLFSNDPSFLTTLIKKYFFRFILICLPKLWKLSFIQYVFEIFVLVFSKDTSLKGYELSYIAVSKSISGSGVGSQLVREAEVALREKNVSHIWVKTLRSTPENIKFYKKIGFSIFKEKMGRVYLTKAI